MSNKLYETIIRKLQNKEISKDVAADLIRVYQSMHVVDPDHDSDIAVIGIGCRFPQANSKEQFWQNLENGVDSVGPFPKGRRLDIDPYLDQIDKSILITKDPYFHGGYLDQVDEFDAEIFNILPGEAIYIDPQQRIFAELALEAFEDAGYGWRKIKNSNTGVYVGNTGNKYNYFFDKPIPSLAAGNWPAFVASRLSYIFNLSGPSMMVSVGCASSLLAVHLACQALLLGDCTMALAGGINLDLAPLNMTSDIWNLLGIYEDSIKCRAFDDTASGIAKGEGAGAIVLKKYQQALRDGDNIYAVIKATVANQDGHSNGITAPNAIAQAEMLKQAWKKADVDPRTISYIEAHGTGTKIGDPIEFKGMSLAFREFTKDKHFCAIGSSKTNIGHLADGAAGVAGLIKTILSLKHKKIPASLHFRTPNSLINFKDAPVYVNASLADWPLMHDVRRAGVSSFGLCGTNVHVVLEEPQDRVGRANEPVLDANIFCLGAANLISLHETLMKYSKYANEYDFNLLDFCFTANTSRTDGSYRAAIVFTDKNDLLRKLDLLTDIKFLQQQDGQDDIYYSVSKEKKVSTEFDETDNLLHMANEYVHGANIDWEKFYDHYQCVRLSLPTYAFNRKRYWPEAKKLSLAISPLIKMKSGEESAEEFSGKTSLEKQIKSSSKLNEHDLLKIWNAILGLENFDKDADFFELGGDSLLAIDLIDKIAKELGVYIDYESFFAHTTFNALKNFLMSDLKVSEEQTSKIVPVTGRQDYMVSFAQKRLWVLYQIQQESVAYNVSAIFEFKGALNTELFIKAFELVINNHESFKTYFISKDGMLYQKIKEQCASKVEFLDYSHLKNGCDVALDQFKKSALSSFDLSRAPLINSYCFKVGENLNLFGYVIHHIIFDGQSNRILFDEVIAAYNLLLQDINFKPKQNLMTYKDYANWQNQSFQIDDKDKDYWLLKLERPLPITEIPGDKIRPKTFTFKGDILKFKIEKDVVAGLVDLCQSHGASLFMGLVAVIDALVYRYTGIRDIITGSPTAGRPFEELKNIIGVFVNTFPLRIKIDQKQTFSDLLKHVKEQALEAYSHQYYPFDLLIDQLDLPKDTSRSPLFNINVALQNSFTKGGEFEKLSDLNIKPIFLEHKSAKWDLAFDFIEEDNGISAYVEYYSDLYSAGFVEHMIENLLNLLRSIVTAPDTSLDDYDLLSDASLKKILTFTSGEVNTQIEHKTVIDLFKNIARANPSDIAIEQASKEISYQDLDRSSNQLAHWLINRGSQGEIVGIYADNSYESIASILGVLKSGNAYLPLDVNSPIARVVEIINDAKVSVVLSTSKYIKNLNQLQWESDALQTFLCLDSDDPLKEEEREKNELMDEGLWSYVGEKAMNEIEGGGWASSYTGENFSVEEMKEYGENVLSKLKPLISPKTRILEIGCASGFTMFALAPHAEFYLGTDISASVLAKNKEKISAENTKNIKLEKVEAHNISELQEDDFDIIIINSVIHCFHGHNYLRKVLGKAIAKLKAKGVVFVGDIMDLGTKSELCGSLRKFKYEHYNCGYTTKTDWDTELFLAKDFFVDFAADVDDIVHLDFSKKLHTVENELTKFRYDLIIEVDKSARSKTSSYEKMKYQYGRNALENHEKKHPKLSVVPDSLAYVLYTSGSTGKPKGVCVMHKSLVNYVDWAMKQYLDENDNAVPLFSPLTFDLTVTSLFCALLSGRKSIVYNGNFEEIYQDLFQENRNSVIKITPSHLDFLLKGNHKHFPYEKYIVGGEALSADLLLQLKSQKDEPFTIFNEYGPTEATVGCVMSKIDSSDITSKLHVLIGKPIQNSRAFILNESLKIQPLGAVGEICVSDACLAKEYLGNEDLTKKKFVQITLSDSMDELTVYRTGDLGRFLLDGNIEYLGRNDNQLKIRGYRVEIDEIQAVLRGMPGITDAILSVKQIANDSKICAYYLSDHDLKTDEIIGYMSETLPKYMLPHFVIRLDAFPLNSHGKLDLTALPIPQSDNIQRSSKYVKPQNETHKKFVEIWKKLLCIDEIGIRDNFFELGGDSIKAIQLIAELAKGGYKADVQDIFEHATIEELSLCVQDSVLMISQEPVCGEVPLTPIQLWFFDHIQQKSHHYNNVVMLKFCDHINEEKIFLSMEHLQKHHDILRAVFTVGGDITQKIVGVTLAADFSVCDLSDCDDTERKILLEANKAQKSLNLAVPPLWKIVLFRLKDRDFLLIIVHHLLIDGISWRILIEDLYTAYMHLCQDKIVALPLKTASYKDWSSELKKYADSDDIKNELSYWSEQLNKPYGSLSGGDCVKSNLVKNSRLIKRQLKLEDTNLLFKINEVFNTNVEDILLTSLAIVLNRHHKNSSSLIMLEKHGRNAIFKDVDITRTLGWFTSIFPVVLDAGNGWDYAKQIIHNKENLRKISNGGVGYGVAKYMGNLQLIHDQPQIIFNYMGQFDTRNYADLFEVSYTSIGNVKASDQERPYEIEIGALVSNQGLEVMLEYNGLQYNEKFMHNLLKDYMFELSKIINYCCSRRTRELTPSDLTYNDISIEQLDDIF